jgi:hypothetical protein
MTEHRKDKDQFPQWNEISTNLPAVAIAVDKAISRLCGGSDVNNLAPFGLLWCRFDAIATLRNEEHRYKHLDLADVKATVKEVFGDIDLSQLTQETLLAQEIKEKGIKDLIASKRKRNKI